MTDQKQAPERIYAWDEADTDRDNRPITTNVWDNEPPGFPKNHEYVPVTEFVRKDLHDAAIKQRDELAAENERLKALKKIWYTLASSMNARAHKAEAERDQALAASAAREIAMRDRAVYKSTEGWRDGYDPTPHIRALPLSPDGQQALDEVRAKAYEAGKVIGALGIEEENPYRQPSRSSDAGKSEDRG